MQALTLTLTLTFSTHYPDYEVGFRFVSGNTLLATFFVDSTSCGVIYTDCHQVFYNNDAELFPLTS